MSAPRYLHADDRRDLDAERYYSPPRRRPVQSRSGKPTKDQRTAGTFTRARFPPRPKQTGPDIRRRFRILIFDRIAGQHQPALTNASRRHSADILRLRRPRSFSTIKDYDNKLHSLLPMSWLRETTRCPSRRYYMLRDRSGIFSMFDLRRDVRFLSEVRTAFQSNAHAGRERLEPARPTGAATCRACMRATDKNDLEGRRFGRWTVNQPAMRRNGELYWNASCDCGRECLIRGSALKAGRSRSCGCLAAELTTARHAKTRMQPPRRRRRGLIRRCSTLELTQS